MRNGRRLSKGVQYTFDSFEVTKTNRKAFEKAKQFTENADSKPLAIFGGTATGKTHLLYAVKNAIEQNSPDLNVILTTTAAMVSSLTNIISNSGSAEQFREQYMQADVLLVDDIQELAGKEKTQDELILLFNMFYESGRRFMMTSSQKESHYGIKDRLLIRSFWGEFAVISKPYINAQLPADEERAVIRNRLLEDGEHLVDVFDLNNFKAYFINIWKYFSNYIGLFDVDRKDIRLVNNLNDILNVLLDETPLKECECQTCILFTKAMLYTISTYDIQVYKGGFYGNGVLYIPLPHHAGTSDCMEITINQFDKEFLRFCEEYQEYECF
ncbi:DnaA/Hda family protein [Ruminococcus sp.]|uniref:DnaA/Hda family protein n=1 Tax=Ruminococcus sp. TaxID=41978 RepID=UPI00300F3E4F